MVGPHDAEVWDWIVRKRSDDAKTEDSDDDLANADPNFPTFPSPVLPSTKTVRTHANVGDVGPWSRATELVLAGDRAQEEEARKRVEEREAAGIEPTAPMYKETWKQVVVGATREIVRVQKPEAAAAPLTPAQSVPPHFRPAPAAAPATAPEVKVLPRLRR